MGLSVWWCSMFRNQCCRLIPPLPSALTFFLLSWDSNCPLSLRGGATDVLFRAENFTGLWQVMSPCGNCCPPPKEGLSCFLFLFHFVSPKLTVAPACGDKHKYLEGNRTYSLPGYRLIVPDGTVSHAAGLKFSKRWLVAHITAMPLLYQWTHCARLIPSTACEVHSWVRLVMAILP